VAVTARVLPGAAAAIAASLGRVCTCAALHVRYRGETICDISFGELFPGGPKAGRDAIFDLASLTKIVVGAGLLALVDQRACALDDPLAGTIPEFARRDSRRGAVTFRHLLTHTSGLPPSANARDEVGAREIIARVCATPLRFAPGEHVIYSDCGFIMLGEAIARLADAPLDDAIQSLVLDPLGVSEMWFRPQASLFDRIVCTENDAWRGRLLRGEVHDETAWSMSGVAGHAGMFGTGVAAAEVAEMFRQNGAVGGRRVLMRPTAAAAVKEQARGDGERRGLAWALKASDGRPCGPLLSRSSFGHTGYTGTSMWVDPERALTIVLLTNRVHYSRDPEPIGALRVAVHDAVIRDLGLVQTTTA
jgi:CubicO group peptidase (beta-lactamase class C family)